MSVARRWRIGSVRRLGAATALAVLASGLVAVTGGARALAADPCPMTESDVDAAAAAAAACAGPVEALDHRTETSRTMVGPDGSATVEDYARPRWVRRADGTWTDVDTTLRVSGGLVAPSATVLPVTFSNGGTGPFAMLADGSRSVSLTWSGALPTPVLSGDTATYAEVLSGVDLRVTALPDGFSEVLVVKNATAARNAALLAIRLSTSTTGVALTTATDGGVEAKDATGDVVFSSPRALMWDSSGDASSGATGSRYRIMGEQVSGAQVTVTPDQDLLTGADTTYPVYIDPQFTGGRSGGAWSVVASRSDLAGSPFWQRSFMTNGSAFGNAGAGLTCDYYVGNTCTSARYTVRSFFRMSTYGAAGATVLDATFEIAQRWSWTCGPASDAKLWVTGGISSATTWNNQPAWDGGHTATTPASHAYGAVNGCSDPATVAFNATDMVRYGFSQGWSDLTLGLRAADESTTSQWKRFDASTAMLHIHYDHAPNTPTLSDLKMGDGGQIGCGASPAVPAHVNTTNGLTLDAVLSDPDAASGDLVLAGWDVRGIAAQYVPATESSGMTSGSTHKAFIPAAAFTESATVSWRASGIDTDSHLAGGWSPTCYLVVDNVAPTPPTMSSGDLALRIGLGIPPAAKPTAVVRQSATVTFTPAPADTGRVVGYRYGVAANVDPVATMWAPAGGDGSAAVSVVPLAATLFNKLAVSAVKADGTTSAPTVAVFKANAATGTPKARGDSTGDGRADLTVLADIGGGRSALWRWNSTPAGTTLGAALAPQGAEGIYDTSTSRAITGDFDGDGLSDVAMLTQSGTDVLLTVERSDGDALWSTPVLQDMPGWSTSKVRPVVGDFTGDGVDDVVAQYDTGSGWTAYLFAANGHPGTPSFAAPTTLRTGTSAWASTTLLAGHFNHPVAVINPGPDVSQLYAVTDAGNCQTSFALLGSRLLNTTSAICYGSARFTVGDFDGNGRDDIAATYNAGTCDTQILTWLGFNDEVYRISGPTTVWDSGANAWCAANTTPVAGDFTGDGKADIGLVYGCCGLYQQQAWIAASTGTSVAPPVLAASGGLGPVGSASLTLDTAVRSGQTRYQLANLATGACAQVTGPPAVDGSRIQAQPCAQVLNQEFTLERVGAQYTMLHPASAPASCVDVYYANTADGTPLQQMSCHGSPAQYWSVEYQSGQPSAPAVRLTNPLAWKCFDLSNGGTAPGTAIWEWNCSAGNLNQQWLLRPVATDTGPVASWEFNEASGGTLADSTGHGITAMSSSSPTLSPRLFRNDRSAGTNGIVVDTSASFGIAAWVKVSSPTTSMAIAGQDGSRQSGFLLEYDSTSRSWCMSMPSADSDTATWQRACSATAVGTGWTQVVGGYDRVTGTMSVYVNGALPGTAPGPALPWRANGNLTLGRGLVAGAAAEYLTGSLDDVAVYQRVLSADEVTTLYTAGPTVSYIS